MSRVIQIGSVKIGGDHPVAIQSMTNTDTKDVESTVAQIQALQEAGCEIVRLSVYDMGCIDPLRQIIGRVSVPLVADIHFDHRLAIASVEAGVAKLRINPGNIGDEGKIGQVARVARDHGVPIRVGANSGSLPPELVQKQGGVNAHAMVEAALQNVRVLEAQGFFDICISVKSSDVPMMVEAYELLSGEVDYPLHLGVTEAGTLENSTIKSAVGIGSLLLRGIGDTVRVSITGSPLKEPIIAQKILSACGQKKTGLDIISCPTCARTQMEVETIANQVEKRFGNIKNPLKVAIMGCVVNGPGEARQADIGIAGGKSGYVIFKNGEIFKTVKGEDAVAVFFEEIQKLLET